MQENLDVISFEDINRIEEESIEYCKTLFCNLKQIDVEEIIDYQELEDLLKRFIVGQDDYLNPNIYYCQHGLRHHLRVQIYSYLILKNLNYNKNDIKLMNFICAIHDTQRSNDYKDDSHGLLAYNVFVKNSNDFCNSTKELIKQTLENHDAKISATDNKYLMILKCADALDRFRLKNLKGWTNFDKVPNSDVEELNAIKERAKSIVLFCRYFTILTEKIKIVDQENNDLDLILNSLKKMKGDVKYEKNVDLCK